MKSKEMLKKEGCEPSNGIESEVDNLTPEEKQELKVAIREADEGETISWEEFLNATKQWRKK